MRFLLFAVFCQHFIQAQINLIADSSFEVNKIIPLDYSGIGASTSWNSPTRGTTDLFCKCNKKDAKISRVNVPSNGMGIQDARSGNCYAGIFGVSHGYYREYLQTTLIQPLEAGKEYVFSMYLSLSDYSRLAIDKIGVCFLNKSVKYEHSNVITNLRPIYISLEEEVGLDIFEWNRLSFIYKAQGGENTILIGGFAIARLWQTGYNVPAGLSSPINKSIERDAYYYIDDVSIYEYKREIPDTVEYSSPYTYTYTEVPDTEYVEPVTIEKLPTNEITVFKNLLFKSGEAIISSKSHEELNIISTYMKADPYLYIEIYGHTDNAGDEQKNMELSENRSAAVASYLVAKGVKTENIKSIGYGSSKPVDRNDTPEGRKNNRRVEFILRKQNN